MPGFRASAIAALMLAAAGLSGCAVSPKSPPCGGGSEKPTAQLVFGRASADGALVSEAEFTRFLDEVVSPRFPDGMTVVDAQGRWTPPAGSLIRDPSKMVMIVLRGEGDERAKLEAVRVAYKLQFRQDSVLLMTSSACVSF
jgi:hypothetical protein